MLLTVNISSKLRKLPHWLSLLPISILKELEQHAVMTGYKSSTVQPLGTIRLHHVCVDRHYPILFIVLQTKVDFRTILFLKIPEKSDDGVQKILKSAKALIEFRTDNSISGRGWVFNWDSNYNTTIYWPFEGLIQSPNYPYMYPNNMEAYWRVVGPLGSTIDFQFNNLDIEFCSTSCTCDVLEIFDGLTEDDTSLLKACGSEIPTRTSTTGNEALLKFMSDALTSGNGFELRYIINACGDTFTAPSATISSPGWPSTLTSPQECYYMITIEPGTGLHMTLLSVLGTFASARGFGW